MKIYIQRQNIFGGWIQYQTKNNERDAYRVAKLKAKQMNQRFRLTDENGNLIDLIDA